MKTIFSFHDVEHRVQLVEFDPEGSLEKYVIYDNRKVIYKFLADLPAARRYFYQYIGNFILQSNMLLPN